LFAGQRHLRAVVREFVEHYHVERNHQGLDNIIPFHSRGSYTAVGRIERRESSGAHSTSTGEKPREIGPDRISGQYGFTMSAMRTANEPVDAGENDPILVAAPHMRAPAYFATPPMMPFDDVQYRYVPSDASPLICPWPLASIVGLPPPSRGPA
jgi:hypothetical protein